MKYNINTNKFETIKVVETKVEIDPRAAFYDMVLENHKEFRSNIVYDYIGHPRSAKNLGWMVMPIGFPPSNSDWSLAVAKALVKFCDTYKTFIVNPNYFDSTVDRTIFQVGLVLNS